MAKREAKGSKRPSGAKAGAAWNKRRKEGECKATSGGLGHYFSAAYAAPGASFEGRGLPDVDAARDAGAASKVSASELLARATSTGQTRRSTARTGPKTAPPAPEPEQKRFGRRERLAARRRGHHAAALAGMKDVTLSDEQAEVLGLIMQGKNVFFTGPAGTGKSLILKVLSEVFRAQGRMDSIYFTAPTGIAACNIGGTTVHSFSGIGLGGAKVDELVAKVKRRRDARAKWRTCECLVIDEISMLSAELFDKLAIIGSRVRDNEAPWGGIQIVICGDFFQLPPVGLDRGVKFAFEAQYWESTVHHAYHLKKIFRQRDNEFRALLREIRLGVVSDKTDQVLKRKVRLTMAEARRKQFQREQARKADTAAAEGEAPSATKADGDAEIIPTKLFPVNRSVDRINAEQMGLLDTPAFVFPAVDMGKEFPLQQLKKNCAAPEVLTLKVGAQVMLLKNLDIPAGLVNGTRGVVTEFQMPNVQEALEGGGDMSQLRPLPVATFKCIVNGEEKARRITLAEETWELTEGDHVLASRSQIPLRVAWALSIHKSQGMSIDHLEVTLNGTFECGQAYVALSRATSLEGLRLNDFSKRHIEAHPKVVRFYNALEETLGEAFDGGDDDADDDKSTAGPRSQGAGKRGAPTTAATAVASTAPSPSTGESRTHGTTARSVPPILSPRSTPTTTAGPNGVPASPEVVIL